MAASLPPCSCAFVMANSAYTLHPNEAAAPSETSVSMFGEPRSRLFVPLMKNSWLMTMTIPASSSWTRPMATWLPSNQPGSGQPHIMWPIEKYIRMSRKTTDAMSRFLRCGVWWSTSASVPAAAGEASCPRRLAP